MTLQNLKYMLEISNSHSFSKAAKISLFSVYTFCCCKRSWNLSGYYYFLNGQIVAFPLPTMEKTLLNMPKKLQKTSQYLEQRYHARKSLPMRFQYPVSIFHLQCGPLPAFQQKLTLPTYDIAIRECDTNSVIHDVAGRKSELGVVAIHEPHMRSMQTLFSSYDIEFHEIKSVKIMCFSVWSSTGFSSCPFL